MINLLFDKMDNIIFAQCCSKHFVRNFGVINILKCIGVVKSL